MNVKERWNEEKQRGNEEIREERKGQRGEMEKIGEGRIRRSEGTRKRNRNRNRRGRKRE